ncbi:hypothetical protein ACP4OV_025533 [Aristida adscensionis]
MMRSQLISCCIVVVIVLGARLTDAAAAALGEAATLRQFIRSRRLSRAAAAGDGEPAGAGSDAWADPVGTFGYLPTKCENPSGSKDADRITALPGQPPRVNFEQYAGYVTVDESHGRELFYYFVESPYDAASKPLVLWLNGGPGCSSLGAGAMQELGPFRVNRDGKTLSRNKHAWNNVANVIFLESPAGVGFSYSQNRSDYTVGDVRTAVDSYVFMLYWLERFPEYKGRDFYIAGESYAGHYVPQLAAVIISIRENFGEDPTSLKGIFVGNPYLDVYKNEKGSYEFLWNHGVISDEMWGYISRHCSFDSSDGILCSRALNSVDPGNIDSYNIYAPMCIQAPNGTSYSSSYLPGYDPCINDYIKVYFNKPEVQKAMHARINTCWSQCGGINYNWDESPITMVPTLSFLIDAGLRVWLYSGDMDDMCPLTATRFSIKDLNVSVTEPLRPWYYPDKEVGGYIQQYEGGFTFSTVRGAGHLVPSFQPKRSLVLFYSFLKDAIMNLEADPGLTISGPSIQPVAMLNFIVNAKSPYNVTQGRAQLKLGIDAGAARDGVGGLDNVGGFSLY